MRTTHLPIVDVVVAATRCQYQCGWVSQVTCLGSWYTYLSPHFHSVVYPPCSLVYLAPATSLAGGNNGCYVTVTVNPSSADTINVWRFKCHRYICNSYFIYTSGAIGRNSCCSCIETRDTNKEIFNLQMGMRLLLL